MHRYLVSPDCPFSLAARCALVVVLLACGNSSPSEVRAPGGATLATAHGQIAVQANGLSFDKSATLHAIDAGYAYAKTRTSRPDLIDHLRLDGMTIRVVAAGGEYIPSSDEMIVASGAEFSIAHELQHRFCWNLGHSGDCCTCQDHTHDALCAGGYDLDCHHT